MHSCLNMFEAHHIDNLWLALPVLGQPAPGREENAFLASLGEDKNASSESSPRPGRVGKNSFRHLWPCCHWVEAL